MLQPDLLSGSAAGSEGEQRLCERPRRILAAFRCLTGAVSCTKSSRRGCDCLQAPDSPHVPSLHQRSPKSGEGCEPQPLLSWDRRAFPAAPEEFTDSRTAPARSALHRWVWRSLSTVIPEILHAGQGKDPDLYETAHSREAPSGRYDKYGNLAQMKRISVSPVTVCFTSTVLSAKLDSYSESAVCSFLF